MPRHKLLCCDKLRSFKIVWQPPKPNLKKAQCMSLLPSPRSRFGAYFGKNMTFMQSEQACKNKQQKSWSCCTLVGFNKILWVVSLVFPVVSISSNESWLGNS